MPGKVQNVTFAMWRDAVLRYGDYLDSVRRLEYISGERDATDYNRINLTVFSHFMPFSQWLEEVYLKEPN